MDARARVCIKCRSFVCVKVESELYISDSELSDKRVKLFCRDLVNNRLISSKQLHHHLSQLQRQRSLHHIIIIIIIIIAQ